MKIETMLNAMRARAYRGGKASWINWDETVRLINKSNVTMYAIMRRYVRLQAENARLRDEVARLRDEVVLWKAEALKDGGDE